MLLAETVDAVRQGQTAVSSPNMLSWSGTQKQSSSFRYEPGPNGPDITELENLLSSESINFRVSEPAKAKITVHQSLQTDWITGEDGREKTAYGLFSGQSTTKLVLGKGGWYFPRTSVTLEWTLAPFAVTNALYAYALVDVGEEYPRYVPVPVVSGVLYYPPELSAQNGILRVTFKVGEGINKEYAFWLDGNRTEEASGPVSTSGHIAQIQSLGSESSIHLQIGEDYADHLFQSKFIEDVVMEISPAKGFYDERTTPILSKTFWYRNASGGKWQSLNTTEKSALLPLKAGTYQWFFQWPTDFGKAYRKPLPPQYNGGVRG